MISGLIHLFGLKGSTGIPLTKTEKLVVVIHFMIQFINFLKKPRPIKHF